MKLKLKSCFIHHKSIIKVRDHPYFKAIKNNSKTHYNNALKGDSYQLSKKSGSWEGLQELINSIKKYGFISPENTSSKKIVKSPIVFIYKKIINKDNITYKLTCIHGRHRLCILYYLFGSDLKIKLNKSLCITKIYN